MELELYEISSLEAHAGSPRAPFMLLFREEGARRAVTQRIHALEHPVLGTLDIFLVPVGPDAQGMRYQAVFN